MCIRDRRYDIGEKRGVLGELRREEEVGRRERVRLLVGAVRIAFRPAGALRHRRRIDSNLDRLVLGRGERLLELLIDCLAAIDALALICLLYTSPSPRD